MFVRKSIVGLAIIGGVLAAVFGPLTGLILGVATWMGRGAGQGTRLQSATLALALASLGLGFGVAAAWTGWRALRRARGGLFSLPRWGWWALATGVVLALGQAAFSAGFTPLMPALHIAAGALPPLLFLSLAAGAARRWDGATSARGTVGSLAWGGLGGVGMALLLEMVIALAGLIALMIWLATTNPDALAQLEAWASQAASQAGSTGQPGDLRELRSLLTTLPAILGMVALMGVVAPLIEEGAKALAVPLVALTGRRLTRLDGFVFGVAAGAGFALFEGILNGALALTTPTGWAGLMLLRGGTAAIHCLAAGLVGLGWQAALAERRMLRGLSLGVAGVLLHGAWNIAAGLQALTALGMAAEPNRAAGVGVTIAILSFMTLLWLAATGALALIPRWLVPVQPLPPLLPPPEPKSLGGFNGT
ncbi:MAG: hypothetical protein AUK03_16810 [Anaerolineae bacterium CG2_30_64_16]|nr:MAG: hypothetical protein AUK03_16810 [Anaerolineae bacterium CG2_30_64_16]